MSGFSRAKTRLDAAIAEALKVRREAGEDVEAMPAWTFHDIRRIFASGCAGLGIGLPVIEKALNHVSGSFAGVVGVYQRFSFSAERRSAMDAWGRHVAGVIGGIPSNIVLLRSADRA